MTEVAAPVAAGLAKADAKTRDKIRQEVFEAAAKSVRGGNLMLNCGTWIVTATK
jgi:hypothetical protein